MKNSLKYIVIIGLFIVLVFSITITNLLLKHQENGIFTVNKSYSEIVFNNVIIDYDIDTYIKTNDIEHTIHFEINDLNDYIEEKTFYIDVSNLGNKDVYVTNMYLSNIDTNIKSEDIDTYISITNGEKIQGGYSKKLIIKIKYNGKKSNEKKYYNFNINYDFNDVVL